jgi:iron complex outermembrane receptor protein
MNRNGAATVATVLAAMLVASVSDADAQDAGGGSRGLLAQGQPSPLAEPRSFDIPAQSLVTALTAFGRQAGFQVSIDAVAARGIVAQAVSGTMRPDQALNLLLTGTGFVARFTGPRAVMLAKPQSGDSSGAVQLDPVQVQGVFPVPPQAMIDNLPPPYAGGQVAKGGQLGLLGNRDVMDTPFNQTNYTAQKAQDQQARTVRDVLVDDPSVRFWVPDGSAGADQLNIRGFQVGNASTTYGGLYGLLPTSSIMPEIAERIEVLKGPNVMLNGMTVEGSIGGRVNVVPKRAPDQPLTELTGSYASGTQFGGHADIARRFGPEKQVGVRMNAAFRSGQTAVENNTDQRALGLLGLDFRGERVRLSADLGYQYQSITGIIPFVALNTGIPLPWAPDARKNFGQAWSQTERKDLFGVVRGEVDLTERITAYAAIGAHDARIATLGSGFNVLVSNFNGNGLSTPLNQSFYATNLVGEAGVRALVDTGPIGHEFSVTGTAFARETGSALLTAAPYATNIYNPSVVAPNTLGMPAATKISYNALTSLGFADTLSAVDKRIQLTVGARLQRVIAANYNPTSGAQTDLYDDGAISPSVALVFKPRDNVSLYGNFIQGLEPGQIVGPEFTNAGQIFAPFKSTQYEAGVKVDWGKFTTTASLFQITRPSTLVDVATNALVSSGSQRNRGLEFNVFGVPLDGVRLLGGFMLLDAVLTSTQGGLTDGWTAIMSPNFQFNIAGEWDLPFVRGLTLNSRVIYTGSQYIDTLNPRRSIPEWTRFDLGARYAFENAYSPTGSPIVIRFNVENVLDTDYWASGTSGNLALGAPRTFRLALTTNF